jgi:hypothetical protein
MVFRVALVLLAVVVIGWIAVLLRDYEIGHEAANRSFFAPQLSQPQREKDRRALSDASLLNPSRYWDLAHAGNLFLVGDAPAAAREAEAIVRAEPANTAAWGLLRAATQESDPARSAEAAARLRALNPYGSR